MTTYLTYNLLGRNGRLGNQLFQIAATAGVAHRRGLQPRFPRWDYQPYFGVPEEFFVTATPFDSEDMGGGYFQELHYFEQIATEVRQWFRPRPSQIEHFRREALAFGSGHATAVHVRRTDYLAYHMYFHTLPIEYYQRAAAAVRAEHPETTFVVFSDDIDWCEQGPLRNVLGDRFRFHRDAVSWASKPVDQYDLFLMMACDRHIIANSTYSWWAAYLSDDPAPIHPSQWYNANHHGPPWRKMIPANWIEVDASVTSPAGNEG
jgi:hypothetical protein